MDVKSIISQIQIKTFQTELNACFYSECFSRIRALNLQIQMSLNRKKYLIVIAGPTAVGKTSLSIALAKKYNSEIISADSRQFFRELEIGTAKPSQSELKAVEHHFINNLSIHETCDAGKFAADAELLIQALFQKHDVLFLVGGSGLYIKALCDGLDEMPIISEGIRASLNKQYELEGLEPLLVELKNTDPEHFEKVDQQNPQRVIRALEVIRSSGKTYSSFRTGGKKMLKNYEVLKIGLHDDKTVLYQRIDDRMDEMIESGLFEEADSFYPQRALAALQTVGYTEIFRHLDGEYDKEEAIRLLKRNSRRYAKRQMTWFRKDDHFKWFKTNEMEKIEQYIKSKMA